MLSLLDSAVVLLSCMQCAGGIFSYTTQQLPRELLSMPSRRQVKMLIIVDVSTEDNPRITPVGSIVYKSELHHRQGSSHYRDHCSRLNCCKTMFHVPGRR